MQKMASQNFELRRCALTQCNEIIDVHVKSAERVIERLKGSWRKGERRPPHQGCWRCV